MQKRNPAISPGQIAGRDFALFESFQRQAELSDYVFIDGSLTHWPSDTIMDLHYDPIVINLFHDYSALLKAVKRYRRRLEGIRPGKTQSQRNRIVACAAIQRTFEVAA
jgi:hypothetical protein